MSEVAVAQADVETTSAEASEASPSPWISSPAWDLTWIFSPIWTLAIMGAATALLAASGTRVDDLFSLPFVVGLFLVLGVYHRLTTTFGVLGTPFFRAELRRTPVRLLVVPAAIVLLTFLGAFSFAFGSELSWLPRGEYAGFFVLVTVYLCWDLWHFAMQEFGLLSIYRTRAGQRDRSDRHFDYGYALVILLFNWSLLLFLVRGATPILVRSDEAQRQTLDLLVSAKPGWVAVLIAVALFAMWREWRHPKRSIPKFFLYAQIGLQAPLLLFGFVKALFLVRVVHHWLVAIGLFNRVMWNALRDTSPLGRVGWISLRFAPILLTILALYYFFGIYDTPALATAAEPWIVPADFSVRAKVIAGTMIGTFFAFNFLHYYYDRCFYRFRDPNIRRQVGSLLFQK